MHACSNFPGPHASLFVAVSFPPTAAEAEGELWECIEHILCMQGIANAAVTKLKKMADDDLNFFSQVRPGFPTPTFPPGTGFFHGFVKNITVGYYCENMKEFGST